MTIPILTVALLLILIFIGELIRLLVFILILVLVLLLVFFLITVAMVACIQEPRLLARYHGATRAAVLRGEMHFRHGGDRRVTTLSVFGGVRRCSRGCRAAKTSSFGAISIRK